jgi:NAD(P)-dependent dehydrogenase (short-subunit alcohol dehydrogenase family)
MVRHRFAAIADDALEITVVGSFSAIGPAIRRRLFGWADPVPGALAGRTVAITGPTSGLGLALTRQVAALGARVVLIGRDKTRLADLRDALEREHAANRFAVVVADMASLASVRAAAERILATEPRLDVLVDNAGAIHAIRRETPDGLEATFALMVAGPFALEAGLLPLLRRTQGARVIAVTSGGMYTQPLPLDDLGYRRGEYSGPRAYARAKRAQVALMREWARRERGSVGFVAMHPGWADTPGLAEQLPAFRRVMGPLLRTPGEGIDTITWLATHPDAAATSGRLYLDRRPRPFDRLPSTRLSSADRCRLWELVSDLAGVSGVESPAG